VVGGHAWLLRAGKMGGNNAADGFVEQHVDLGQRKLCANVVYFANDVDMNEDGLV